MKRPSVSWYSYEKPRFCYAPLLSTPIDFRAEPVYACEEGTLQHGRSSLA